MKNLTAQNSNGEVLGFINDNLAELGSSVTVSDTDASTLCATLNEVFEEYDGIIPLTSSMSGSEFAEAVNYNFTLMAEQQEDVPSNVQMKFLHISDTHGYTDSFTECISRLSSDSDIGHLLITGDMTKYGNNNYDYAVSSLNTIKAMGDKLLMCPGNHDTYDNTHRGYGGKSNQVCETAWLNYYMGENVIWGDTDGETNQPITAGYWYKDIVRGGSRLRIIGIDQYEVGSTVYSSGKYNTVYSQEQVDWLLDLLYNTPSNYNIIIMMHEPAVQSPSASQPTDPDSVAISMAACNLFTSELLEHFGNRRNEPSLNLLPRIMRAYLHQENLSFTYNNKDNKGGHGTLTITKDFRNHTPATFLFYIGGHQHEDICGYIPYDDWNDQLMLFIAAGDSRVPYGMCDDLIWNYNGNSGQQYAQSEPSYRINEVTLDFVNKTITVKRIGNKTTALYNTTADSQANPPVERPHGGRVRNTITFPFKKQ